MPLGAQGAAFFQNSPLNNSFITNTAEWARLTQKNIAPLPAVQFTGFGGSVVQVPFPDSGLGAWLRLQFEGTLTVATAAMVTTDLWPWGLVGNAALAVNGQTQLISCNGLDLRAHRNRLYRNPVEQVGSAAGTDSKLNPISGTSLAIGTYDISLSFDIPICHDLQTLVGLIYLQTSQNDFGINITPGQVANLLTGAGTATLTGTFYPELTFFDIPEIQGSGQQAGGPLLPSMAWLHSLQSKDTPQVGTGAMDTPLGKYPGQLLCLYNYVTNGTPGSHVPVLTGYDGLQLQYGLNRAPMVWVGPTGQGLLSLLDENQADYNGLIGPEYFILDFEKDDPARDAVYPVGLNGFQLVPYITAADALAAGSKVHVVSEILYSAS